MTELTSDRKAELRALCEAATPEPWSIRRAHYPQDGEYNWAIIANALVIAEAFGRVSKGEEGKRPAEVNGAFIVASRAAIPELLNEIDRLTKERDEARLRMSNPFHESLTVDAYNKEIAIVSAERDAALAQIETLKAERDTALTDSHDRIADLTRERDAAEAERDRMGEVLVSVRVKEPDADNFVWLTFETGQSQFGSFNLGTPDGFATKVALEFERQRRAVLLL
jgi:hypothetical protein